MANPSSSPHRLAEVPLFAGLPKEALDQLASNRPRREIQAGQQLFMEGDEGDFLVILEEGKLCISRFSGSENETVLAVVEAPAALGELSLLDGAPRDATVTAQERSWVRFVPRKIFLALLREQPAFVEGLLVTLAGWVRHANRRQAAMLGLDVPGRLAHWLLERSERQDDLTIDIGRTQEPWARELGTTRSTLNRALNQFKDLGYIDIDGDRLTILKPDALRAFVG